MSLISTTLKKFKLTKLGVEAEFSEWEEVDGGIRLETEVTKKFPFQPAEEIETAFEQLVPHLLMLTEFVNDETVLDPEDVLTLPLAEVFRCTGMVVKSTGVTLIGRRRLRGKKILNITTPFLLWETAEGMDEYRFHLTFQKKVQEAELLCLRYIEGDYLKQAAYNTQLEIPFEESQL